MANPPGNHQQEANHASSSFNGGNLSNGSTIPDSLGSGMKHNTGIALDWTLEEQAILDEGLKKFASESSIIRYAKIAMQLQNKTVRDVALRCRWMTKKENSKRRKEEHNLARKSKDKKERVADPSTKPAHFAARPNVSPYAPPMIPMDYDDGIPYKAGIEGWLLELFVKEPLVVQQENFWSRMPKPSIKYLQILQLSSLNDMPDIMKQMPPLPVKVNDELAGTILPPSTHMMQS
ncbi:hypothetical protein QQP08_012761 [Theobroma cacao]|nr:hypothetical protein QQP08_012761 [Theobroma cacao]